MSKAEELSVMNQEVKRVDNDKAYKGYLAIIAANIIFGINTPITQSLVENWLSPITYTLTRMIFGTVVFWIIGSFFSNEKVSPKDLLLIAIGGFFGFVAMQLTLALSVQYTSSVNYSLMMSMTPILVLLLSVIFLREGITTIKIIGTLVSIAGTYFIILQGNKSGVGSNNLLGIFLAILSSASYGIYLMLTRRISITYSPITVIKYTFLFSSLMILPFGITNLPFQRMFSSEVTVSAVMQLLFALIFSTILAFFLMPIALKRLKATTVSIYMNLQPLTTSIIAIAIGQDVFGWGKLFAGLTIIVGVLLVTQSKK